MRRVAHIALVTAGVAGGLALAGDRDRARARLRVDAPAPLFAAPNLVPGQRSTACARVTNTGDASGRAALYAPGIDGALAEHLTLTVTRRTSCHAGGGALVFRGPLASFPRARANALPDAATWRPGDAHTYRFDLQLGHDPAAEGRSATWSWRVAVETLAGPATACRRLRGRLLVVRHRALTLVAVPHRDRVVLRLSHASRARRARYRINGRLVGVATKRPFRVRPPATRLRPGVNRIALRTDRGTSAAVVTLTPRCTLSGSRPAPSPPARGARGTRRPRPSPRG
jgi:hypothetical protein